MAQIITKPKTYPIQPRHIDTSLKLFGAFENLSRDMFAYWIVVLSQRLGGWEPFTQKDIEELYAEAKLGNVFSFCELDETLILLGDDGFFRVTHKFVVACFASSPKSTIFRSEPSIPDSPTGKYIVRLWDGSDREWIDVSGTVDKREAIAIWNKKTKDGTVGTCYEDFDYFAIFPSNTKIGAINIMVLSA